MTPGRLVLERGNLGVVGHEYMKTYSKKWRSDKSWLSFLRVIGNPCLGCNAGGKKKKHCFVEWRMAAGKQVVVSVNMKFRCLSFKYRTWSEEGAIGMRERHKKKQSENKESGD